ncbi:hypothetical protein [Vagococcus salmoninarum]|uniref:hypothetical protein n=1 Tax=Vagococcus salmoninarum TaxID=2739 RepID=UPI00187E3462|nr:hypothetical protein [Vagococcus salmoninarum]MBE9390029.1 hypothetical protein [Vagococcus salmoninarum]
MQEVRFPIFESSSYLVTYLDNATGDKYGMYVRAVDKSHAKKLVRLQTTNTTVLSVVLAEAKKENFV